MSADWTRWDNMDKWCPDCKGVSSSSCHNKFHDDLADLLGEMCESELAGQLLGRKGGLRGGESKQEARLPEKAEDAIGELIHQAQLSGSEHSGFDYEGAGGVKILRSAILAALDEARDEALEEAAAMFDGENAAARFHEVYQNEAHRRGDVRHPDDYEELSEETKEWDRVLARDCALRIRFLKSKRGA